MTSGHHAQREDSPLAATIAPGYAAGVLSGRSAAAPQSGSRARSRVDLAGAWQRYVNGKLLDVIPVPSSQCPLGFYRLKRDFLLPALSPQQRALLHFDAITYHGRVFVNGVELGTTIPYIPHEFDFTRAAKEGKNLVEVAIADLRPDPSGAGRDEIALGVNPGWEAYGGIIRDVYAEVRPAVYIDNVRFGYQLADDNGRAACQARVMFSSATALAGHLQVVLIRDGSEIARAERDIQVSAGSTEAELTFDVTAPDLWSPEQPNLYELEARWRGQGSEDVWTGRTGFRRLVIRGNQFELNGSRLVLNGVCRHDMWKDQGFTLTPAQMAQDMTMIKALGANYVRLVHYPHHRRIVELADELGLLVTEEPGYWGMNLRTMPPSMIELGYRIMDGTIRRDWNSPSVFAWLLGNECTLTAEYLREGKERCRKLDPLVRPVSFANSMDPKEAKPIFEQVGMDFFDAHVYPSDSQEYAKTAEFYGGSRPLTFTEWGWETAGDKDIYPETHSELVLDLVQNGKLAGHAFWSWQDVRQYSRLDWPTADGILMSGVVDEARVVRPDLYLELSALFQGRAGEPPLPAARPAVLPLKVSPSAPGAAFHPLDLQPLVESAEGIKSWAALEAALSLFWPKAAMAEDQWKRTGERFQLWPDRLPRELVVGGIPFQVPFVNHYARPLILTAGSPGFVIPVDRECERLHFLGQVTLPVGYPLVGKRGQRVATYRVTYKGGAEQEIPVRAGQEAAQANLIHAATRIDSVATEAQRAMEYVKDVVREHYQVLLWTVEVKPGAVETLKCTLDEGQPALAMFAITAEARTLGVAPVGRAGKSA